MLPSPFLSSLIQKMVGRRVLIVFGVVAVAVGFGVIIVCRLVMVVGRLCGGNVGFIVG